MPIVSGYVVLPVAIKYSSESNLIIEHESLTPDYVQDYAEQNGVYKFWGDAHKAASGKNVFQHPNPAIKFVIAINGGLLWSGNPRNPELSRWEPLPSKEIYKWDKFDGPDGIYEFINTKKIRGTIRLLYNSQLT